MIFKYTNKKECLLTQNSLIVDNSKIVYIEDRKAIYNQTDRFTWVSNAYLRRKDFDWLLKNHLIGLIEEKNYGTWQLKKYRLTDEALKMDKTIYAPKVKRKEGDK